MYIKHKESKIFGFIMAVSLAARGLWSAPHLTIIIAIKSVFIGIIAGSIAGLVYDFVWHKLKPKITKQSNQSNKSTQ